MGTEIVVKKHIFSREVKIANILLSLQFILGMYVNLYVEFPKTGAEEEWIFAWGSIPVAAHILLGSFILLASISLLIRSIIKRNRRWIIVGSAVFGGILLSYLGGAEFITTQNELPSLTMALGFIIALMALDWGYFTQ